MEKITSRIIIGIIIAWILFMILILVSGCSPAIYFDRHDPYLTSKKASDQMTGDYVKEFVNDQGDTVAIYHVTKIKK